MPPLKIDPKTGRLKVSEANIEKTCTRILELDGWRSFKMEMNFSERKRKAVGEPGMPDRLYIRYHGTKAEPEAWAEVIWVEWKTPKGKLGDHQGQWRFKERRLGALSLVAGLDFYASIEGFQRWYEDSGLKRNRDLM